MLFQRMLMASANPANQTAPAPTPFSTSWRSAGAGANDSSVGSVAWSNPGNVTASDDSRASATTFTTTDTQILRATDFGFTESDVPNGATILGIEVEIERGRNVSADTITDHTVSLRTSEGQTGDNKADTGTNWGTSDTPITYGGADDAWDAELSDGDIRLSTFGVDFRAQRTDGSGPIQVLVDHIRIRIHGEV